MFDIYGDLVNVDVRESRYPIKAKSRSSLQGLTASKLREEYPMDIILEDFTVPGSQLSVDFFLPKRRMVVEVQGRQHDEHVPFFHGDKTKPNKFAGQISKDRQKQEWAETNGYSFIEIRTQEELENL